MPEETAPDFRAILQRLADALEPAQVSIEDKAAAEEFQYALDAAQEALEGYTPSGG